MDAERVAGGGVDGGDRGEPLVVCVTGGCPGVASAGGADEVAEGGAGGAGTIRGKGLSLSAKGGSTMGGNCDCDTVML